MADRVDLQYLLEDMLGSRQVYYQPPEHVKMSYPAIVYDRGTIRVSKADNLSYMKNNRYTITYISKTPDDSIIWELLDLEYCSHDRHYISDGLHHDVFTIYY